MQAVLAYVSMLGLATYVALLCMLAFEAYFGAQRYRRTRAWVPIQATVTSPGEPAGWYGMASSSCAGAELRYQPLGEPAEATGSARWDRRTYRTGELVKARYNPARPSEVIVDNPIQNGAAPAGALLALLVISALGVVVLATL